MSLLTVLCVNMSKNDGQGNVYGSQSDPDVQDFLTLVENIGVEPMTSCMPCKRSSQLS